MINTPAPELPPPWRPDPEPALPEVPPKVQEPNTPEQHAPVRDPAPRVALLDARAEAVARTPSRQAQLALQQHPAQHPHTRRRFVAIVPFAGLALLAACSDKSATTASPPAPQPPATPPAAPPPAPAPATAPAAVAPAPAAEQAAAPAAASPNAGAALPALTPSDPAAVALGYVAVASQADAVKYPKYAAGQACGNCVLFGGKPGDASGPCPLFAGKSVSATGWCSSYTKKGA
jgi:hypothetical protein